LWLAAAIRDSPLVVEGLFFPGHVCVFHTEAHPTPFYYRRRHTPHGPRCPRLSAETAGESCTASEMAKRGQRPMCANSAGRSSWHWYLIGGCINDSGEARKCVLLGRAYCGASRSAWGALRGRLVAGVAQKFGKSQKIRTPRGKSRGVEMLASSTTTIDSLMKNTPGLRSPRRRSRRLLTSGNLFDSARRFRSVCYPHVAPRSASRKNNGTGPFACTNGLTKQATFMA
jgi:hypothetical protein